MSSTPKLPAKPPRQSADSAGREWTDKFSWLDIFIVGLTSSVAFYAGCKYTDKVTLAEPYNNTKLATVTYPSDGGIEYSIIMVTDLDHDSKETGGKRWQSLVSRGRLHFSANKKSATILFDSNAEFYVNTQIAAGGRAMELSDLAVFNGHLYSIDDRTGLIYWIKNSKAIPWVLVNDGPGDVIKGFKGEWMTVKDGELIVGGLGKEWTTTDGEYVNDHPMWIKYVSTHGAVRHENWSDVYKRVRGAAGIEYPGYMIHEAVQWSAIRRSWFFLPRRMSKEKYTEADDENRGTNVMVVGDENLMNFKVVRIGGVEVTPRGFSAFQFVPNTDDKLILAVKSEEKDGKPVASYATVFDVDGNVILPDFVLHGPFKYEGVAFA